MVNQTIEQLLQEAIDQSMAQTQESRELADDVSGLIGEIRSEVTQAVQRTDQAIADVNTAIPTAVADTLYQNIYLDPVDGDDANDGTTQFKSVKTIKVAIDKAPRFGKARIHVQNDLVVDVLVDITDKYIEIDLNGHLLDQKTSSAGVIGCFRLMGETWVQLIDGSARTSLKDANVATPSINTALFRRQDLYSTKVYVFGVHTELGDHAFMSAGQTGNGIHELGFGHSNIMIRDGATINKFIYLANSTLSFTFCVGTKPAQFTWNDLIDGIVRASDNEPRNIISNVEI